MTAPKRRWPRFSLRTMFVVLTCPIAVMGWAKETSPIVQKMQGTWIVVVSELGGLKSEREIGDEVTIVGDRVYDPSGRLLSTFTIDSSQDPLRIDFVASKRGGTDRLFGIVKMGEKTLRIAYGGRRPTSFNDARLYFVELVRKAEKND